MSANRAVWQAAGQLELPAVLGAAGSALLRNFHVALSPLEVKPCSSHLISVKVFLIILPAYCGILVVLSNTHSANGGCQSVLKNKGSFPL